MTPSRSVSAAVADDAESRSAAPEPDVLVYVIGVTFHHDVAYGD